MIEVYARTQSILNKDKARLPIGYLPCLTAELRRALSGYMDVDTSDLEIQFEYVENGKYEITMRAVGERLALVENK